MKDLSLASIKKTVERTLNYDDVATTFNLICYRTNDIANRVLKVLINTYYSDEDNSKVYVVVVTDLLANSESFICNTKETEDPVQVISSRIADIAYSILWDTMHWLESYVALYATIVSERFCVGLRWYVTQAEKLTGTTYQDAPSYGQSRLVRKAIQLLYLSDNEGLSTDMLETRIDEYLSMKKIAEY